MTAHAERVGVLVLLGVLMLCGWCAVALGVAADSGTNGVRTVGAVVSKRAGSTTIVVGGPFAAAAIVVPNDPEPRAAPVSGELPDTVRDLPIVFGSVAIFDSSPALESSAVPDSAPVADTPDARDAAMLLDGLAVPAPSGYDGAGVILEADRILADSAALEEL